MEQRRPNPDELLHQINRMEQEKARGRLKIFFGYAAGVGKTYTMLQAAHLEKERGKNVLIGYLEPHMRPETTKQVGTLPKLPPRELNSHGVCIREFDLDAALAARCDILLVDELAHTNAPGSRHEKRYQDVKELLAAGIDVFTTVNVQHIESINDLVAGVTGVIVRERIPDSMFDNAASVELVDIEPEELLARMQQGKIYQKRQAENAMQNFFSVENLIALREIALRRMADRVNLIQERQPGAKHEGRMNSAEHFLLCLSASPSNQKVIRQAFRMVSAFHGKLTAVYVETPSFCEMSREDLQRLKANTRLAESLGAKTVTLYGTDVSEQIAEYIKLANVNKVILGRSYTAKHLFAVKETFSEKLVRLCPEVEVFLIPDSYQKRYRGHSRRKRTRQKKERTEAMLLSCAVFAAAILLAVLFDKTGFCVILCGMLVLAAISSATVRTMRLSAKENAKKAYAMELLLETSTLLQSARSKEQIAAKTAKQLAKLNGRVVYFYLGSPEYNRLPFISGGKAEQAKKKILDSEYDELAVAAWVYKNNKRAGFSTATLPGAGCLYLAVRDAEQVFGVVGMEMNGKALTPFEENLTLSVINECALALGRTLLMNAQGQDTHSNITEKETLLTPLSQQKE